MRVVTRMQRGSFCGVILAVATAALLRALIPFGYMVAIEGGALALVPCSGVVMTEAGAGSSDHSAHQGHHPSLSGGAKDGSKGVHDDSGAPSGGAAYSSCPFATSCCLIIAAPIRAQAAAPAAPLEPVYQLSNPPALPVAKTVRARAPPVSFQSFRRLAQFARHP